MKKRKRSTVKERIGRIAEMVIREAKRNLITQELSVQELYELQEKAWDAYNSKGTANER